MTESAVPPKSPPVSRVVLRVEYEGGSFREFSALRPHPFHLAIEAGPEEASLPVGMTGPERKEPVIGVIFGGSPEHGGVTVRQEGVL